ncbi:ATP synthase F1 subunit delta [Mycoplasmopsis glycophila]|uniref:ATP synthase subunit delta n=1 Tax=Mycoplasmopsis glycophila TaxID=171285 RepID=A0A449AUW4_9BACT|nr:ATP synthase F1 subunit delta [Mycoplasmopsis glycophila]VEU70314.1 ATP synthase F1, delta subunit [Mycoplasmopsis glycophila]
MYAKRNIAAYSVAIFDLVKEEHELSKIQPEFENLLEIIKLNPELVTYLGNDLISEKERLKTIELVFKDFHWIILNTLKVIVQRRMSPYLKKIIIEYLKLSNKELKIRFVRVVSAFPLDDNQLEEIKNKLQKVTRRTIKLKHSIDPNLISGIRIESRTEILEMNIKHDLEKIKLDILKTDLQKGK